MSTYKLIQDYKYWKKDQIFKEGRDGIMSRGLKPNRFLIKDTYEEIELRVLDLIEDVTDINKIQQRIREIDDASHELCKERNNLLTKLRDCLTTNQLDLFSPLKDD